MKQTLVVQDPGARAKRKAFLLVLALKHTVWHLSYTRIILCLAGALDQLGVIFKRNSNAQKYVDSDACICQVERHTS